MIWLFAMRNVTDGRFLDSGPSLLFLRAIVALVWLQFVLGSLVGFHDLYILKLYDMLCRWLANHYITCPLLCQISKDRYLKGYARTIKWSTCIYFSASRFIMSFYDGEILKVNLLLSESVHSCCLRSTLDFRFSSNNHSFLNYCKGI